jgi:hypothetical protein
MAQRTGRGIDERDCYPSRVRSAATWRGAFGAMGMLGIVGQGCGTVGFDALDPGADASESGSTASEASSGGTRSGATSGAKAHPAECIVPPVASQRKAPLFDADGKHPAPPNPAGLVLRLMNNCPLDLWVYGINLPAVELPPKQAGQPPAEEVYDWPGGGGRIYASEGSANGFTIDFVAFNAAKGQALNIDLSNVEWVGIPAEVRGDDPSTCLTACYSPLSTILNGCPPQLLDSTHHICQAPKNWCANAANLNDPLCASAVTMATSVAAADPKCSAAATDLNPADIYGCAGPFWSTSPYCCAELTRGYKTDIDDPGKDPTQNCDYYEEPPYSLYSAYSQTVCPFVYSFAYDDWNSQSGYAACAGAQEMDITYCPGDP